MIYADFIDSGDLCFDVGANEGNKSQELLDKGARVVAFEPQKDCFLRLTKRFGNAMNITLENIALGRIDGDMMLRKCAANTLATLSDKFIKVTQAERFKEFIWDKSERIHVSTLDAMIMKHGAPKFCKIDVEGYEIEVLKGLSSVIPYISIEYTPELFRDTLHCLMHLQTISPILCNYGHKEHDILYFEKWLTVNEIEPFIRDNPLYRTDRDTFGDVYIKMKSL